MLPRLRSSRVDMVRLRECIQRVVRLFMASFTCTLTNMVKLIAFVRKLVIRCVESATDTLEITVSLRTPTLILVSLLEVSATSTE